MEIMMIMVLVGVLGLGLANLGCTLYVVYKLFQEKGIGHALLGFFCCQLYPFIWGWVNAARLKMYDVMIFWSAIMLFSMILQGVVQILGGDMEQLLRR